MKVYEWILTEAGLDWDEELREFTRYAVEAGIPEDERMSMFLDTLSMALLSLSHQ